MEREGSAEGLSKKGQGTREGRKGEKEERERGKGQVREKGEKGTNKRREGRKGKGRRKDTYRGSLEESWEMKGGWKGMEEVGGEYLASNTGNLSPALHST